MTTFTFTTDAADADEEIIAHSYCSRIVIYENGQAGTADYLLRMPKSYSPQITRPAGSKTEISGKTFSPNEVVGYIASATGSLTMAQEEY